MASLIIQASGQRVPLGPGSTTIGRGARSTIRFSDPTLGPVHCQIIQTREGHRLIAIDQRHGVVVNGVRVQARQLKDGDRIQIGSIRCRFVCEARARVAQPIAAGPARRPTTRRRPTAPRATTRGFRELERSLSDAARRRVPIEVKVGAVVAAIVVGVVAWISLTEGKEEKIAKARQKIGKIKEKAFKEEGAETIDGYDTAIRLLRRAESLINELPDSIIGEFIQEKQLIRARIGEIKAKKGRAGKEEEGVARFIGYAEEVLERFEQDEAQALLRNHEWIPKARFGEVKKARELYGKIDGKIAEHLDLKRPWRELQADFNRLLDEKQFKQASALGNDYLKSTHAGEVEKARARGDLQRIKPEARDYLRGLIARCKSIKLRSGLGPALEEYERGIVRLKGILPGEELKRGREEIRRYE
jgi:hypothetical protein